MKLINSIIGYALIPSSEGIRYYVYCNNGKRIRVTRKTYFWLMSREEY